MVESQQKEEDVSCLPTLLISDIEKQTERTKLQHLNIGNALREITVVTQRNIQFQSLL